MTAATSWSEDPPGSVSVPACQRGELVARGFPARTLQGDLSYQRSPEGTGSSPDLSWKTGQEAAPKPDPERRN